MSDSSRSSLEGLPPGIVARMDQACDTFEAALQRGESPNIHDLLIEADSGERQILLRELLQLEMDYRERLGESIDETDYRQRYPHDQGTVEEVFHHRHTEHPLPSHQRDTLRLIDDPPADADLGLQVRCPHCHQHVEIVEEAPLSEITCHSCGSQFSLIGDEESDDSPSTTPTIAHFEILNKLGTGGFGSVWRARDTQLEREVAIKIPRRTQLRREEEELFLREARVAAQLKHPNIVTVHEVGRESSTLYIVSDLVDGISLSQWADSRQLSFHDTAILCAKIATALDHAHGMGVIHRDLKPSNIMMNHYNEPHITDFGLAKRQVGEITMTMDGQILGTPAYMSPEQARGQGHQTDRRTDIYSLGVIVFQLLTGELPFRGDVPLLIQQVLDDDPPSPRKFKTNIPTDLETICLKCMEKEPANRYSSCKIVSEELHRYLRGEPIRARPISRLARTWRWCMRYPVAATLMLLLIVLAVVGPAVAVHERQQRIRIESLSQERLNILGRTSQQTKDLQARVHHAEQVWKVDGSRLAKADQRRVEQNRRWLQAARRRFEPWVQQTQQNVSEPRQRIYAHLGLAGIALALGRHQQASQLYQQVTQQLQALAQQYPENVRLQQAILRCELALAELEYQLGNREQSRQHLETAIGRQKSLVASAPDRIVWRTNLADMYRQLVSMQQGETQWPKTLDLIQQQTDQIEVKLRQWRPQNGADLYRLVCEWTGVEPLVLEETSAKSTASPD